MHLAVHLAIYYSSGSNNVCNGKICMGIMTWYLILIMIGLHLPLHHKEHNRLLAMLSMSNIKWVHHLDATSHNQILRTFLMLWWYVMVTYVLYYDGIDWNSVSSSSTCWSIPRHIMPSDYTSCSEDTLPMLILTTTPTIILFWSTYATSNVATCCLSCSVILSSSYGLLGICYAISTACKYCSK